MLAVLLVDTVAAGAFYPLTFLYLTLSTDLPVSRIGLILTGGGLIALVLNPIAGSAADRWGAQRTIVAANFFCGLGYAGLLDVGGWPQLVAAVACISFSQRLYWVGWPVFVAEQVAPGETLDRWFAVVGAFKSGALGLGAAAAAVALAIGDVAVLRVLLLAAVLASFLSAAVFFRLPMHPSTAHGVSGGPRPDEAHPDGAPAGGKDDTAAKVGNEAGSRGGGWRTVLGDRPYTTMTAAHTMLTFAWLLPSVVLPVYLVQTLSLPPWVPSVLFALNTAMTVLLQTTIVRVLAPLRRTRAILVGSCSFLLAFAVFATAHSAPQAVALALTTAGIALFSFGEMAVGPPAQALSMEAAPVALRGRYSSVFQMSWTISSVGGPALLGVLLQGDGVLVWLVLGALVVLGGLGFTACEKRFPAGVLRSAAREGSPG